MSNATTTAFVNMRRSPYQSLAAIMVLTITFFISYVFVVLMIGSEFILRYFETQPQITAFFQTDAAPETITQAEQKMKELSFVKDVQVISKEQALQIYREDNKDDPLLLELVTADILPASIEVSATDILALPQIEEQLRTIPQVDEIVYQRDIVESLTSWTRTLRLVGVSLIGLLVSTSIFVIIVITGMKVASKRSAIRVMQLLGASRWYIKAPFLYEGVYYGILGAILGWIGLYVLTLYLTPWLLNFLQDIPIVPIPPLFMLSVLAGGIISGALIGGISSFFSSQRLLKH